MGFLQSLFGTEEHEHIDQCVDAFERAHAVLLVNAKDEEEADLAKSVMEGCSAVDIEERAANWSMPESEAIAKPTPGYEKKEPAGEQKKKIPVVEEEIQVGKREVDRGTVRIYTHVTEKPVEKTVNLKEKHVFIERRLVDRPATESDFANEDRVIEVRSTAEEPVVSKRARVVEEVEIGRTQSEHSETVRDTVRRKDVELENPDGEKCRRRGVRSDRDRSKTDPFP